MANFQSPDLMVGDLVLWYSNPFSPQDAAMGWISSKPGTQTVKILIWAEEAGFVEKPSVRHKEDPYWVESPMASSTQRWGCYELHPSTKALKEIQSLLTKQKIEAAKGAKKPDAA